MFQNLKAKIHKAKENGLTTLLRYVTCPKSMNYEIILTIIVSNSLKFELVQFFFGSDSIYVSGGTTYFSKVGSQTWSGHFYALNLFFSYFYAMNFLKLVIFLFK